jgi:tetratricopeptide (TPR) repeat protein
VEGGGSLGEARRLPESTLGEAEAAFRRAVAADPNLAEARLRRARVRLLRGRAAEAIPDLRQIAVEGGSVRRRYLARLFEARAHEERADLDSAVQAYRAAVATEPGGQSAWLGLALALDRLGRPEEAQAAFSAALASDRDRGDPWWSYPRGDLDRLGPLLAELQAAVAR